MISWGVTFPHLAPVVPQPQWQKALLNRHLARGRSIPLPARSAGKGWDMKHRHIMASFQLEVRFKSLVIVFSATEGVSHRNRSACFKTKLFSVVWISKTHLSVYGLSAVTLRGAREGWTMHLDTKGRWLMCWSCPGRELPADHTSEHGLFLCEVWDLLKGGASFFSRLLHLVSSVGCIYFLHCENFSVFTSSLICL